MKKFVKIKSHTIPFPNLEFGILYFFAFFLNACVKDIPNPSDKTIPNGSHKGVLILNEGSYANNNAEISFWIMKPMQYLIQYIVPQTIKVWVM